MGAGEVNPGDFLPDSTAGTEPARGWKLQKFERVTDGVSKYYFSTPGNGIVEVHFSPAEPGRPAYATTGYFDVAYRSERILTEEDEAALNLLIEGVRDAEVGDDKPEVSVVFIKRLRILQVISISLKTEAFGNDMIPIPVIRFRGRERDHQLVPEGVESKKADHRQYEVD